VTGTAPDGTFWCGTLDRPIVYLTAGNSDDRLTQCQWAGLIAEMRELLQPEEPGPYLPEYEFQVVFEGFAAPHGEWQNACWAVLLPRFPDTDGAVAWLRRQVAALATRYGQDSISWVQADHTDFLAETAPPGDRSLQ
jgi:hypothetical protein